jgi:hypothetical protein
MIDKLVGKAAAQPIQFAIGAGIVVGLAYFVLRHAVGAAAKTAVDAVGGIASGNNALTLGTPYEDKGIVGTLAGAANRASGGSLQSIGEALGGWVYDITHRDYDPRDGLHTAADTLADGSRETDSLWGRVGSVLLRSN